MGSINSYCQNLKPSPKNNTTKLITLSHDLPQIPNPNAEHDSCPSDCESGISREQSQFRLSENGLIRIYDGEMIYEAIRKRLLSSLTSSGFNNNHNNNNNNNARVESIHRKDYSGIMGRAKITSFSVYSRAMEMKCGGNANLRYAWFGASKNEIRRVLCHGFGHTTNSRTHGQGVYLSPLDHPIESMQSAVADEDGLKHMLLCRVILGKSEVIRLVSKQDNPSSEEFDSGIDNLVSPQKYIIWTSRTNTHILPEFVVSYRASSYCRGFETRQPSSDWMPFPSLINVLSKYLPCDAVELIKKHHGDFKKLKITRFEMIQLVRHIAGDKLLMSIIKSYRGKIKEPLINGSSSLQQSNKRK